MGCDIHYRFEAFKDGAWRKRDRDYYLFAILAGVHNETWSEYITPISEPRGLPDGTLNNDWEFGDHSFSWLLGSEILTYDFKPVRGCGVVDIRTWRETPPGKTPSSYCSGVYGPGIVVSSPDQVTAQTTHVRATWNLDLREQTAYFFGEVRRLVAKHGEVRFVFGFDSYPWLTGLVVSFYQTVVP